MTPASSDPPDLIHRLRQQLILAQVRIMELEDERDEHFARLQQTIRLLGEARELADQKLDEAAHLEAVRADLQAQYEHMRHMQHVTNEALNASRCELAASQTSLQAAESGRLTLQDDVTRLTAALQAATGANASLTTDIAARDAAIAELGRELAGIKASRSWRWTAWLRRLGRKLGL